MPRAKKATAGRGRTTKAAVRRKSMILESDRPRRVDLRMAPPKQAERQHARPGSGIKRSRAAMLPKSR